MLEKDSKLHLILLGLFSFFFNQYVASKGSFPIDSFYNFDAAANITFGNHPFKDYWLITGPFLDYVQSFIFIIFGISRTTYVIHASLINSLLTLFAYYFFINIGLKKNYSFLYSLGIAILAYPTIGTPFIDHHAVFFCIMALFSLSLGILTKKKVFWIIVPFLITFSFFSKQIPSPYFVVLFSIATIIYFFIERKQIKNTLISLFIGTFFSLILVIGIFIVNKIPVTNFLIQYIYYPYSLGSERINQTNLDFSNLIAQFKFIYIILIPLIISTFYIIKIKKKKLTQKNDIIISFIFLASVFILIYCQLITKNQVLIFFLIPITAGYSHLYVVKYYKNKYLVFLIMAIFVFTTAKYHIRFNENRKFIELVDADFSLAVDAIKIDKRLKGLKWITPHYPKQPLKEIELLIEIKNILSDAKASKIIITDYQFLNTLTYNKIATPNKWYDVHSIPRKENKYYNLHKDFFLNKIKINNVERIFFVGKNKNKMNFFVELLNENECITQIKINEIFSEFEVSNCKF